MPVGVGVGGIVVPCAHIPATSPIMFPADPAVLCACVRACVRVSVCVSHRLAVADPVAHG